ncbi:MAG: EF-hand domain-containing protein [Porticoccaceae bacterium]
MKTLFAIIATLGLASSAVLADTTTQGNVDSSQQGSMFDQLDSDRSGNLNEDEASAAGISSDDFKRLDTNGDGELSRDEVAARANSSEDRSDSYGSGGTSTDGDASGAAGQTW